MRRRDGAHQNWQMTCRMIELRLRLAPHRGCATRPPVAAGASSAASVITRSWAFEVRDRPRVPHWWNVPPYEQLPVTLHRPACGVNRHVAGTDHNLQSALKTILDARIPSPSHVATRGCLANGDGLREALPLEERKPSLYARTAALVLTVTRLDRDATRSLARIGVTECAKRSPPEEAWPGATAAAAYIEFAPQVIRTLMPRCVRVCNAALGRRDDVR
jgi:hypothetical protein